jgi:hypothetical protein
MSPVLNVLDKGWPFAASVLTGVFAFGAMHADVNGIKKQHESDTVEIRAKQASLAIDHDAITRLEQGQEDMKSDLTEIKQSLRHLESR